MIIHYILWNIQDFYFFVPLLLSIPNCTPTALFLCKDHIETNKMHNVHTRFLYIVMLAHRVEPGVLMFKSRFSSTAHFVNSCLFYKWRLFLLISRKIIPPAIFFKFYFGVNTYSTVVRLCERETRPERQREAAPADLLKPRWIGTQGVHTAGSLDKTME
jgi:hypothetical protein